MFVKWEVLLYLELLVVVITLYRMFSRNISRRRLENKKFLSIKNTVMKPFRTWSKQIKDKNNIYKKCHKCKTTLKLPLAPTRGINHAKCPECGERITIFTLRKKEPEKIKVEVIKKKK